MLRSAAQPVNVVRILDERVDCRRYFAVLGTGVPMLGEYHCIALLVARDKGIVKGVPSIEDPVTRRSQVIEIHPYMRRVAYVRAKNPTSIQATNANRTRRLMSNASLISILAIARCFFRLYHPPKALSSTV